MAFKKFVILHNEMDGASRFFVAGQVDPENPEVEVMDWYAELGGPKEAEYRAAGLPDPSAFPSVVNTETGDLVRVPKSLDDAIRILTGQKTLEEQVIVLQEQVETLSQTIQEMLLGGA
jgi:hypothetical protein